MIRAFARVIAYSADSANREGAGDSDDPKWRKHIESQTRCAGGCLNLKIQPNLPYSLDCAAPAKSKRSTDD